MEVKDMTDEVLISYLEEGDKYDEEAARRLRLKSKMVEIAVTDNSTFREYHTMWNGYKEPCPRNVEGNPKEHCTKKECDTAQIAKCRTEYFEQQAQAAMEVEP